MTRRILVFPLLLFISIISLSAQKFNVESVVNQHIQKMAKVWNLTAEDTDEIRVTDEYVSKHNGVTHIYLQQMQNGIPVYNAVINLNISKEGRVVFSGNTFISKLDQKINTSAPGITNIHAVVKAAHHLGFVNVEPLVTKRIDGNSAVVFEKTDFSASDIPVGLTYQPTKDGQVRLAWDMAIDQVNTPDNWSIRVDAMTGEILGQDNFTIKCTFEKGQYSNSESICAEQHIHTNELISFLNLPIQEGAQYRVYPFPAESPIHGESILVVDPHDPEASPFGWHDIDGKGGPEFTITRGNNAHAYIDKNADNFSDGGEPDGGAELSFDFEHKTLLEPDSSLLADQTNLFYVTNMMHDLFYQFGFDEVSGNFQQNNYDKGGAGGDYVEAQGLDGVDIGNSNNANFFTPSDGSNPIMQMYQWTNEVGTDDNLEVLAPNEISGIYEGRAAAFGASIIGLELEGKIVVVDDKTGTPTDGCTTIQNGDELSGNIAMIDRGRCEFGLKSLNAQNAGAAAVLICNVFGVNGGTGNELITMGGGADGGGVNIPALFMKKTDCDLIKLVLNGGTDVNIRIKRAEVPEGPTNLSSSFDNGIIAHEIAHGISNRLTGGPNRVNCLFNDEQMGEGWSDFFSLITTVEPGDDGTDIRGVGNYVLKLKPDGRGIRNFPYSTDMNINPHTFDNIKGTTAPHPLGEVWTAVLWDMYWAFVELYGWDADWSNTESGNFKAIQLVMDGMKFQQCSPGFIEGRDAILAADDINYNGDHWCMLWEIFANRGMGWDAEGGNTDDRNDGKEGFEPFPTCIKELKIQKTTTEFIDPGEDIEVTLTIANHKEQAVTGVVVRDAIPEGLSVKGGSSSFNFNMEDDNIVFEIGTMESLDEMTITYTLTTPQDLRSVSLFLEDMEDGGFSLVPFPLEGNGLFNLVDLDAFSGDFSYYIFNDTLENDQVLMMGDFWNVFGENPALRFWHKYNTEAGFDGGFVEISTNGEDWSIIKDEFVRNGYDNSISFFTAAIPALEGYSGNSDGEWIDTYIDLSAYQGQNILIRFRFLSDDNTRAVGENPGWFIDDFQFLDLAKLKDEACISSLEGDLACDASITIIDSDFSSSIEDELFNQMEMNVFPNPTSDKINISISSPVREDAVLTLHTMDGKEMLRQQIQIQSSTQSWTFNTNQLPAGFYIIQLASDQFVKSTKVVVQ